MLVVDDGVATGSTLRVCLQTLGQMGASEIWVALPGGASLTLEEIAKSDIAARCVAISAPDDFHAVDELYLDFSEVTSEEVVRLLKISRQ